MSEINDKKLLRLIQYAPVILIVLFALVINAVVIVDNREKATESMNALRQELNERQKETISQHVQQVVNEARYQKTLTRNILEEQARTRVSEAHAIASNIYQTNREKSDSEIASLISEALRPVRFFEGRGYYFVFQMDGINVMHGLLPEIEGKSGWNTRDVRGTLILQEHIRLIEQNGEAFYRWWYPKPGQPKNQEFEKVGFGKHFEPFDWFIGTGEYLADVESDVKTSVLKWITDYRYGEGGFIFVLDKSGKVLAHRDNRYVGQNIRDLNLTPGLSLQQLNLEHETGDGYLRYKVPLSYGSEEFREKISYVESIDDWGWFVGSGFYVDEYEAFLSQREARLHAENQDEFVKILLLSSILTLLMALLSLILGRAIARRFYKFQTRISHDFDVLEDTKDKMQHMALHDALTGLPNRMLLIEKINSGVEHARKHDRFLAVMFVDLDDFKKVNDLYGHSSGDKLLEIISRKFETIIGPGDSVSRFGGDEFIFCFTELEGVEQAWAEAENIQKVFNDQFVIDGKILSTKCSIGVSMYPSDSDDAESLIRKADIVLYKSKAIQKGEVMFYDQKINEQVQYDYLLEEELRRSVLKDEITLLYQPQIDAVSKRITGVEALARWHNQRLGAVSPVKFISVAENIGMIQDIGRFVFRKACEDILTISPNGEGALSLSVNISPKQITAPGFVDLIMGITEKVGIDIRRITLEITENVLIEDVNKVTPVLYMLKNAGFGISLDDFGTGFSSLSYLNNLPISEIKIDRCFVDKILVNEQSNTLIKAIIAIGESCEMKVVAEGVETKEQYKRLSSYGCTLVQGYYFDRPLPVEKLAVREYGQASA